MKSATINLIISILILSLTSCTSGFDSAELKIVFQDWSGDSEGYVPKKSEETYTVSVGDTIDLGGCCDLTVTVDSISNKGISITTSVPMSVKSKKGTINLLTDEINFFIDKDEQLKLVTPTMDRGYIYYFDYIQSTK